jgi:DNA (cytosine-5)-methyltransferase 1|tara:strand:- start:117 stop:1088 length:972 start_codon:yes stop_codon:yes gene_type:complete
MLKVLDLFSGIGGFSLGLEQTGHFKTVAFCEIDKYCRQILEKHWKKVKIYNDVKEITKERLQADGIDPPAVITGGFPCQPFSVAGNQKGTSDNRYLWPDMFRIIQEFTPVWIIAENVKGITNIQDGMVFETVCTDLEGEGYEVRAFNIPAAGVGAPHRRERIWIVANSRRTIRGKQSSRNQESIEPGTSEKTEWSANSDSVARSSKRKKIMANTESISSDGRGREQHQGKRSGQGEIGGASGDDAHANSKRLERFRTEHELREGKEEEQTSGNSWWLVEPNMGRVAHGVSGRVHRLKGLGNSIVPQIAEEIGKAIYKATIDGK